MSYGRWQPDRADKCQSCGFGRKAKIHTDPKRHGYHEFKPKEKK